LIRRNEDGPPTSPTIDALQQMTEEPAARPSPPADPSRRLATGPLPASVPAATPPADPADAAPSGSLPRNPQALDLDGTTVSWQSTPEALVPGSRRTETLAGVAPRVARFVLLDRLGSGGMGVVYAAFDEKLERKVAIKLVAAHAGNPTAQARLLREAQAQARLTHPNVVTVYEVGTLPEGQLFIAMELVKGSTLRDWQSAAHGWQEIVAKYAAAGEGLAAAHRAGIIHRDFKPDNVLVGDDGRVRVADFGLAFAVETEPAPNVRDPDVADAPPAAAMTAAGVLAGTPGYMAPERFAGAAVDARTDQFSFCVALYEALHGERPYADLAFATGERPAPRRSEPDPCDPRWLWDAVMRGLAHEPAKRFASMDALLAELTRNRGLLRRRHITAATLAGLVAIAAAVSVSALGDRDPPPCPLATAELDGIWDPATKLRVGAALLGTGAPFAAAAWTSTQTAFDQYAQRWVRAQRAACEATHVRHVQSEELLDRRMECLAGRRRSLAAAVEVLHSRPAQALGHAGEILSSLGEIDLCADTAVLLELPRIGAAPANVVARAQVAEVRRQLAGAAALLAAGDVSGAEPVVAAAARFARDLDYEAIRAELRFFEGRIKLMRGNVAESIALFEQAVELATSSHHDELTADIWLTLAVRVGEREARPVDIESWLGQGEAWIRRLGHANDPRRIDVEHARGELLITAGKARDALGALSRAVDGAEQLWGKDDPRLIPLLRNRALAHARAGQAKPAIADGERALALGVATWGPEYPDIARTRRALGLLYIEQLGDVERGEREIVLAMRQFHAQLGGDSIEVANCEQALSLVGQYRGDYAAALQHAERAEQIYAVRLGADHPRRGEALMGLGVLRFMRSDFVGSLDAYETAYPILRAALGPGHTTIGLLRSNTGETLLALGRGDAAKAAFEQALEIMQPGLGSEHDDLALPLKGLGLAHLSRGRTRAALEPLERALALRIRSSASDPQELAEIRWALARVLRALRRDPARARELAEAALAGYRGLGSEWANRVQEILRWLAAVGRAPDQPRPP
jgi:eukaryotic-like serine/threonine-protein kinase